MDLPPEIVAKQVTVPGGAYRKFHEYGTEGGGPKPRFFFILNKSPENDKDLIIVTSTTQISSRYKARYYKVLVRVSPNEYNSLPEESLIDCNSAEKIPKGNIVNWIKDQKITPLPPLPDSVLNRLRDAIKHSSNLNTKEKRLVLGSDMNIEQESQ